MAAVRAGGIFGRTNRTAPALLRPNLRATPDQLQTPDDVAEIMERQRAASETINREMVPRFFRDAAIFQDLAAVAGVSLPIRHGLGRRVNWLVVDWAPGTAGQAANFARQTVTTSDQLVLLPVNSGTVSIMIF